MDTNEKIRLITRNCQEVLTEEDLKKIIEDGTELKHYIGFEISGMVHLGTGLISMGKIADFLKAGAKCKIFLADFHSYLNNKLGVWKFKVRVFDDGQNYGEFSRECTFTNEKGPVVNLDPDEEQEEQEAETLVRRLPGCAHQHENPQGKMDCHGEPAQQRGQKHWRLLAEFPIRLDDAGMGRAQRDGRRQHHLFAVLLRPDPDAHEGDALALAGIVRFHVEGLERHRSALFGGSLFVIREKHLLVDLVGRENFDRRIAAFRSEQRPAAFSSFEFIGDGGERRVTGEILVAVADSEPGQPQVRRGNLEHLVRTAEIVHQAFHLPPHL